MYDINDIDDELDELDEFDKYMEDNEIFHENEIKIEDLQIEKVDLENLNILVTNSISFLSETNNCKDIIQKFIISKYNIYKLDEYNIIIDFLKIFKNTCIIYKFIFKNIIEKKISDTIECINKSFTRIKIQNDNIKEIDDLIDHFNRLSDCEQIILNMIDQPREDLEINNLTPSTSKDIIYEDFDIIYHVYPFYEKQLEPDMLLDYIFDNMENIKTNNTNIQNILYK